MERDFTIRSHHDMGGLKAGHIEPAEHEYELWEKNPVLRYVCRQTAG